MKTDTSSKIIELCRSSGGLRPAQLAKELGISNSALHRQLKKLLEKKVLFKQGSAPYVIYRVDESSKFTKEEEVGEVGEGSSPKFPLEVSKKINKFFCYFSPSGKEYSGLEAFQIFLKKTSQDKFINDRALEYIDILNETNKHRLSSGLISGLKKISDTFSDCSLDEVYYADFYSLPKYGKTKLGQYLLHGKSGQSKKLIENIAIETKPLVESIICKHGVNALCYAPHSIPRKIPFLDFFQGILALDIPLVLLKKAYKDDVLIAQKSLSKLSERIENARETIFLAERSVQHEKVLIIDDALGSGATINEISKKLKLAGAKQVYAFVITGSYKGFEVIKEV